MMGILEKTMSNMKLSKFELNIECKKIIEALNTKQASSRFVGGFVRNYINNTDFYFYFFSDMLHNPKWIQ